MRSEGTNNHTNWEKEEGSKKENKKGRQKIFENDQSRHVSL
jgi:hypothetical protein